MHRGEIYLVDLSNQVGSEQTGIRPALIVQNEQGNQHSARQDTDRNPRYADAARCWYTKGFYGAM